METTVIVAIIAAVATVLAAIIGLFKRNSGGQKDAGGNAPLPVGVSVSNVVSGRDTVVAARDAIVVHQEVAEERLISKHGAALLSETVQEVIKAPDLQRAWDSFDLKFISACVKDTHRGFAFDGEAARTFLKPEHDRMLSLGFQVYNTAGKNIENEDDPDHRRFYQLMQIYTEARMFLRTV